MVNTRSTGNKAEARKHNKTSLIGKHGGKNTQEETPHTYHMTRFIVLIAYLTKRERERERDKDRERDKERQ